MHKNMNISLYPDFSEVFADNTLKGIFYPLCSVTFEEFPEQVFHFVSSNGLWMDEEYETSTNTFHFTLFDVIENKYQFTGDRKLYMGAEIAQAIFPQLVKDFDENGTQYLKTKMPTEQYIQKQKKELHLESEQEFDADYYLQTFYEFSINKLHYKQTQEFGAFRGVIEGWPDGDNTSPIVYDPTTDDLVGILNQLDLPEIDNSNNYQPIGMVIGYEFFTDGNDTVLFSNSNHQILCVNNYS